MRRCCELTLSTAAALLVGCGSCQGPPSELKVDGPTPYVRCMAAEPPDDGELAVGAVKIVREGRELTLRGLPDRATVVAFAGPGPATVEPDSLVRSAKEREPDLVVVLGDLGDAQEQAERTLAALASLEVPVLVVAGGRDDAVVWEEAFDSLDGDAAGRVVDATPYRRVLVGPHELVPVAGAPEGRYARTDQACGFGRDDLEEVEDALGDAPAGQRILLSWAAPAGWAEGLEGADPGDPALGELVDEGHLGSGLFAWPPSARPPADGAEGPLRLGVRPVSGPAVVGPDGSRATPGPTALALGPEGLKISD